MFKSRIRITVAAMLLTLAAVGGLATFASDSAQREVTFVQAMTWQPYANGFMLYNQSDASITVFFGNDGGAIRAFSVTEYGSLPAFNPYVPAQAGRIPPVFGFGKVWWNYSDVGTGLGWPTRGETSYTAIVTRGASGFHTWFTLPEWFTPQDERRVLVDYQAGTWSYSDIPVPPPPPVPTATSLPSGGYIPSFGDGSQIATTYQSYQGGSMFWLAGTGDIIVLYNTGTYDLFRVFQYATLPDNPINLGIPAGRIRPVFGFGKVWGNFSQVRNALGWAISSEQGRFTPFQRDNGRGTYRFGQPTGGFIEFDTVARTWVVVFP